MNQVPFAQAFDKSQTAAMQRFLNPFQPIVEIFTPEIKANFKKVRDFGFKVRFISNLGYPRATIRANQWSTKRLDITLYGLQG
jgi:hypothetical protein